MGKPLLLDLFCGAGGCSVGYSRAGFDVVGVDLHPQKNYPFGFVQADAISTLKHLINGGRIRVNPLDDAAPLYSLADFDAIHASPPCQRYSVATKSVPGLSDTHPDLVPGTRELLIAAGKPYVIENVIGAPLGSALMLCGSMFGLLVRRHRLFECSHLLFSPGGCRHHLFVGDYPCGRSNQSARSGERSKVVHVYGQGCSRGDRRLWSKAMGIEWMTMREMAQSIPPAYTVFVGRQLMTVLESQKG